MSGTLFLVQVLNGFQLGVLLFLIAAGLTLIFGILGVICGVFRPSYDANQGGNSISS